MKQLVLAYATVDGVPYVGTNSISDTAPDTCPREGMAPGEGYDLCKSECGQKHHAEQNLVEVVPDGDLKGADVYLIGHTYACKTCLDILKEANAGLLFIEDGGKP